MNEFSMNFTVQFNDISQNTELTNHGFLRLMQETASVHSDTVGYSIRTAKSTGVSWILLNWKLKIVARPKWNDKITITTWVRHMDKHFSFRNFEVIDENKNVLAVASSKWTLVDTSKHSLVLFSEEFIKKYPITIKPDTFDINVFEKIQEPKAFDKTLSYVVQKRDIDANHHVNNLSYLDFANENLPEFDFKNVEICYKKEAKYGDTLVISHLQVCENQFIIAIKELDTNKTNVILKIY